MRELLRAALVDALHVDRVVRRARLAVDLEGDALALHVDVQIDLLPVRLARHLEGEHVVGAGRLDAELDALASIRDFARARGCIWIKFDADGRRFVLTDLGSSNGTFIQIRGEVTIKSGDQFRIGQQLFRVDLSAAPAP